MPFASKSLQAKSSMKTKRRILYVLIIAVALVVIAKISLEGVRMLESRPYSILDVRSNTVASANTHQTKTILLWTPFFGNRDYIAPLDTLGCSETRCNVTSDRNLLYMSDAIVFHHRDIKVKDLPPERHVWQRWVYLNHESPPNSRLESIVHLDDKFNWTITYRLDSDILLTPLPSPRKTVRTPDRRDLSQNKTRMAAWFVSSCHTPSNREEYVAQLRKTIPVDIYGQCGWMKCKPKMSNKCYEDVAKNYRFYLSFENSICRDYVTEKMIHIFDFDMVPVVFGGADYKKVAPPDSYINAMDFRSPRALGRFLLEVAKSPQAYNKYFRWKSDYETSISHYACQLCQKLHDPNEPVKIWTDLKKWWFDESHCRRWPS